MNKLDEAIREMVATDGIQATVQYLQAQTYGLTQQFFGGPTGSFSMAAQADFKHVYFNPTYKPPRADGKVDPF